VLDRDARGKAPAPRVAEGVRVAAELCRNVGPRGGAGELAGERRTAGAGLHEPVVARARGDHPGARRGLGRDPTDQELEPFTFALAARAAALKPEEIEAGGRRRGARRQAYEGAFAQYDVLLSPVMMHSAAGARWMGPMVPYPLLIERLMDVVGYTPINNVSGGPGDERAAALDARRAAGGPPLRGEEVATSARC
jgi:amidase